MKTAHIIIYGRVQGVWYRKWAAEEATKRQLSGWVRNRSNGSVEAYFQGDDTQVDDMVQACYKGPLLAKVDKIEQVQETVADLPKIQKGQFLFAETI